MPTIGDLNVRIGATTDPLIKGINDANRQMKGKGAAMASLAKTAGLAIAGAFVSAGLAGTKMAIDIEQAFSKIENLVGVTGSTLDGFKDSVRDVSTQTGKSQSELANALFTITSAGLQGADALEVLNQAAKASVVGMGDTKAIAQATAAVLTAYGTESITASKAIDTMTAIVRAGNLEAESLAPALGRVVGIAAQVGVSFDELGANVAAFTRLGVSADEAITGLRGLLNGIIKPTKESTEALASVGMTFAQLRAEIKEKGLSYSLNNLVNLFGDNTEGLSRLIPSVEALANVLGTAGAQGEVYAQIAADIANSTDIVNDGFAKASETVQNQWNITLANAQARMQDFGNRVLPVLANGLKTINSLGKQQAQTQEATALATRASAEKAGQLVAQYESLAKIQNKTSEETAELQRLTFVLAAEFGESVTQVNQETGALEINRAALIKQAQARAALASQGAQDLLAERARLQATKVNADLAAAAYENLAQTVPEWLAQAVELRGTSKQSAESLAGLTGETEAMRAELERLLNAKTAGAPAVMRIQEIDKALEKAGVTFEDIEAQVTALNAAFDAIQPKPTGGAGSQVDEVKQVANLVTGYVELSDALTSNEGDYIALQQAVAGLMGLDVKTDLDNTAASMLKVYGSMFQVVTGIPVLNAALNTTKSTVTELSIEMGGMLQGAINQFMASIEVMAAGGASFGDVIKGLLMSVLTFADQLGDAMIATGLAGIALKMVFASPGAALAAGLALKLFAGIARGIMSEGPQTPALAQGGLAFGPTLAMVGDNPGARSNPEVIAPLDKLAGMLGTGSGSGGELYARLTGEDLLLSTQRASTRLGRINGK